MSADPDAARVSAVRALGRVKKILEVLPQFDVFRAVVVLERHPGLADGDGDGDANELLSRAMAVSDDMRLSAAEARAERAAAAVQTHTMLEEIEVARAKLREAEAEAALAVQDEAGVGATAAQEEQPPEVVGGDAFRVFNHPVNRLFVPEDSTTLHVRNAEAIYLRMLYMDPMTGATSKHFVPSLNEYDVNKIQSIDYVFNEKLAAVFEQKKLEMLQDNYPGEEMLLFHGTRTENVQSIIKDNFNLGLCHRFAFGRGLYFSELPSTSFQYGEALILCRVLIGRVQDTGAQFDPSNYHSFQTSKVNGGTGVANIHVVASPDQVLPYCVYKFARADGDTRNGVRGRRGPVQRNVGPWGPNPFGTVGFGAGVTATPVVAPPAPVPRVPPIPNLPPPPAPPNFATNFANGLPTATAPAAASTPQSTIQNMYNMYMGPFINNGTPSTTQQSWTVTTNSNGSAMSEKQRLKAIVAQQKQQQKEALKKAREDAKQAKKLIQEAKKRESKKKADMKKEFDDLVAFGNQMLMGLPSSSSTQTSTAPKQPASKSKSSASAVRPSSAFLDGLSDAFQPYQSLPVGPSVPTTSGFLSSFSDTRDPFTQPGPSRASATVTSGSNSAGTSSGTGASAPSIGGAVPRKPTSAQPSSVGANTSTAATASSSPLFVDLTKDSSSGEGSYLNGSQRAKDELRWRLANYFGGTDNAGANQTVDGNSDVEMTEQ